MDYSRYAHSASTTVAAPPEAIYDLVSDVTRMGEWSPVCSGGTWDDDAHQTWVGVNTTPERTWSVHCRVLVADRGREFTFLNEGSEGDAELVRWSYTFAPQGDSTVVTESWQVLDGYEAYIKKLAPAMDVEAYLESVRAPTAEGMAHTLSQLKAAAEK